MEEDLEIKKLTTRIGIKGNTRYITITDNIPEHWDSLISITKTHYNWYAYIFHNKDVDEKGEPIPEHIHIVAYDKGGTSLKKHCERFATVIPSNFVEKVVSGRGITRYLIHKDSPEKYQYDLSEVLTNDKEKLSSYFVDSSTTTSEYADFCKVQSGELSVEDFINLHLGEFYNLNLYQKVALFRALRKELNYDNRRIYGEKQENR